MVKTTKTKTYDTATASVVKKVTSGSYGDPEGYEMTMYVTEKGDYFLYTYGGESSPYPVEKITAYGKTRALAWIEEN